MSQYKHTYELKDSFIQKLRANGISKSSAGSYATCLFLQGKSGDSARKKWHQIMMCDLPVVYYLESLHFSGSRKEVVPFYVGTAQGERPQLYSVKNPPAKPVKQDAKPSLLLIELLKEILGSPKIDDSSKIALVEMIVKKLENIGEK